MGIKGFSQIVKEHAPNSIFQVPISFFNGKRIAIDMGDLLYSSMSIAVKIESRKLTTEPPNQNRMEFRCLEMILNRLKLFLENSITPVCIFDTFAHPLKSFGLNKRHENKQKLQDKLNQANNIEDYTKFFKQNVDVSHFFGENVKVFLKNLGFSVFATGESPFENIETRDAEGICANLCRNNYCYAGMTPDADFHVYGGNIAILQIEGGNCQVRILDNMLNSMKLNFYEFRDLCILSGTDYNSNIYNVGPVKCWNYIQMYRNISNLSRNIDVSILNYDNVIKVFDSTLVKLSMKIPMFDYPKFLKEGRNILSSCGLESQFEVINILVSNLCVEINI
ncbi:MAG: PIN domain-containing protein [Acidimicrobiales bacterium]